MKCAECGGETRILITQSTTSIFHRPPLEYEDVIVIRRRRECLKNPLHKVWTIEIPEKDYKKLGGKDDDEPKNILL